MAKRELATRVSPARHVNHVRPGAEPVVSGERIGLEVAPEAREKPLGTVAIATRREVVDAVGIPDVADIDPESPDPGLGLGSVGSQTGTVVSSVQMILEPLTRLAIKVWRESNNSASRLTQESHPGSQVAESVQGPGEISAIVRSSRDRDPPKSRLPCAALPGRGVDEGRERSRVQDGSGGRGKGVSEGGGL